MKRMIARPILLAGTICTLAVAIWSLSSVSTKKNTPTAHSKTTECVDTEEDPTITSPITGHSIIFESMTGHLLSIHF